MPKTISPCRDRLQSGILVLLSVPTLLAGLAWQIHSTSLPPWWPWAVAAGMALAAASWWLRASTLPAAALGFLISLALIFGHPATRGTLHRSSYNSSAFTPNAFPALLALVLITHAATRFGRSRKEASGTAEPRTGRRASQVAANLAVAALCATGHSALWFAASLAALAEATADTVSSEIGQAFSGPTWLVTSARRVPPGTDGGISLPGTLAGFGAAALIPSVVAFTQPLSFSTALVVTLAAAAGLLFDSLLGATLERQGWMGNDLVNLSSTAFAAALAFLCSRP